MPFYRANYVNPKYGLDYSESLAAIPFNKGICKDRAQSTSYLSTQTSSFYVFFFLLEREGMALLYGMSVGLDLEILKDSILTEENTFYLVKVVKDT